MSGFVGGGVFDRVPDDFSRPLECVADSLDGIFCIGERAAEFCGLEVGAEPGGLLAEKFALNGVALFREHLDLGVENRKGFLDVRLPPVVRSGLKLRDLLAGGRDRPRGKRPLARPRYLPLMNLNPALGIHHEAHEERSLQ